MRTKAALLMCLILTLASSVIADVIEIDNEQLEQLRADGVVIIDVRRPDEWRATGLLEGSHPITFFDARGQFDIEAWLSDLGALTKPEDPLVLICASGVRSANIAAFLDKKLGFLTVYDATRGINGWMAEKRPLAPYASDDQ